MRRDKFRHYGPCSVAWSSLAALVVLCVCLLVLIAQSVWPYP
jgi:hypothetical protein